MLCSISGEVPQEPVASKITGSVFEKRLIETFIADNGTDPITGEPLSKEDLVELRTAKIARPRPPTLTSIPALLSAFQNEWDALTLESFKLNTELLKTRQELSTALYQHDAAVRVIARLTQERDQAVEMLSKFSRSGVAGVPTELPERMAAAVAQKQQELQSTRRKRPIPDGWATSEQIESFSVVDPSPEVSFAGGKRLALDDTGSRVLVGGQDGTVGVYSITSQSLQSFQGSSGAVTDGVWWNDRLLVAFDNGEVKLFDVNGSEETVLGNHKNGASSVAVHPCGIIAVSAGADGAYNVYDLSTGKLAARKDTGIKSALTSICFHPDGHLIAIASGEHSVLILDFATGSTAAQFDTDGPADRMDFSETGVWLAVLTRGQSVVSVWDLRKAEVIKTISPGGPVLAFKFDYTAQFLAVAGPSSVAVFQYHKAGKHWTNVLERAAAGTDLAWGPRASSLIVRTPSGGLSLLN